MHCTIVSAGSKTRGLKADHHDADGSRSLHNELSTHSTCARDPRYCFEGADSTSIEEDHDYARNG